MSSLLFAFLVLSVLGLLLGIGLSIANKKFHIEKDNKLVELENAMPGANCGGCGFAGCQDYANAVFNGTAKIGLCSPGGQDLADKMGCILGVKSEIVERKVACVFCDTSCDNSNKNYDYRGIEDCNAAALLFNGNISCKYGCLHMLSCVKVCESSALSVNNEHKIIVDRDKCVGCGMCVSVCPHNVIKLIPYDLAYIVKCNNHDKGAQVIKSCSVGCIGCGICQNKHPESGITVIDNLAVTSKEGNSIALQEAAAACPKKIIKKLG